MTDAKSKARYQRLTEIDGWQQDKLQALKVFVAGAGALGNEFLKNLALLGVKRIVIVDFDSIELSNLSRAILFREEDEGKAKVTVAAQRIMEINPEIQILAIQGDLRWDVGYGVYRRMDIFLGGLDNVAARRNLNRQAWIYQKPFFDAGLDGISGMLNVFVPPSTACYECGLSQADYEVLNERYSCQGIHKKASENSIPTSPTIASIIAALGVQEMAKWVHGMEIAAGYGLGYNGNIHRFFLSKRHRREDCIIHQSRVTPSIHEVEEASCTMQIGELIELAQETLQEKDILLEFDRSIVTSLCCTHCRQEDSCFIPRYQLDESQAACPNCGHERIIHEQINRFKPGTNYQSHTLAAFSIPPLHVMTVRDAQRQAHYFELTGDLQRKDYHLLKEA